MMKNNFFSRYLQDHGLPVPWQLFLLGNLVLSTLLILINNANLYQMLSVVVILLNMFGFSYQLIRSEQSLKIWGHLFLGVILIKFSLLMQVSNFYGAGINNQIVFWFEQFGIALITIFAFLLLLLFEKKFQIKGITADITLTILSVTILVLLISPNLLELFLQLELAQQLLITKLLFGIIMLFLSILLQIVAKQIFFHNTVLTVSILFTISHFGIDLFNSLGLVNINPKLSMSFYHFSGSFALIFIFTEKISFYDHTNKSYALGSTFMWIATIMAVSVIPFGIFVRWHQELQSVDNIFIGLFSFILSSFVIWRLVILIRNTQDQGKNLKKIAFSDPLTQLPNYLGLIEKMESTDLHHNNNLVIAVDIDDFRSINDLYGRHFGDEVLRSLANRLRDLPNIIMASRVGTDFFIIIFSPTNPHILIQNIQKKLGVWDVVSGHRIAVPLTYGFSKENTSTNPKQLIDQAEKALSIARIKHKSYSIFNESIDNNLPRLKIREILQQAIDKNFLPVHFQPIYNINDGSLNAMELLIRLQTKKGGILMPGQFLKQAQDYGLLTPLTKICINMIAKDFHKLPNVTININLPPYMLDSERSLNEFISNFQETQLPVERFCIEVLEDQDIPAENLLKSLIRLKELGFSIAMDDFGTGYSSLARLSMLPFDTIKIDRSILLAASSGNKTILESAITLIKRLGISTVVEGVETTEQLNLIKSLGAEAVQGFLLSKPVAIEGATKFPLNATTIIAEF